MNTNRVIKSLGYLHRILEAGEKGYAVSASNVNNQGLKILLRSYAQQRARFKSEIFGEMQRLGGSIRPRSSLRGILHRGRIDIFAALTIGSLEREAVVLKEITVGEAAALRSYESILKKDLPAETCAIVQKQYDAVRKVIEQIHLMRGAHGMRLVVQLFDDEKHVDVAMQELTNAGIRPSAMERIVIQDSIELYSGKGTTVIETALSGAAGGAMWGGVIGAIAGIGAEQSAATSAPYFGTGIWSLIALLGILAGAFIGFAIGYFIGIGISEDDTYMYDQGMERGRIIILALVNDLHIPQTSQIMAQVHTTTQALAPDMFA